VKFPKPKKVYDYQEMKAWLEAEGQDTQRFRRLLVGKEGCGQNTVCSLEREYIDDCEDHKDKELMTLLFAQTRANEIHIEVWW